MARERTHYDLLDVGRTADAAEIARQWKTLIQVWHPDRFDGAMREQAEQMTARLNEAYHTLRDPARRTAYDAAHPAQKPADAVPTPEPAGRSHRPPSRPATAPPPVATIRATAPSLAAAGAVAAVRRHPTIAATAGVLWGLLLTAMVLSWLWAGPSAVPDYTAEATAALNTASETDVFEDAEAESVAPQTARATGDSAVIEELRKLTEAEAKRQELAVIAREQARKDQERAAAAAKARAAEARREGRVVTIRPEAAPVPVPGVGMIQPPMPG